MDLSTFLYGLLAVSFSERTNAYQERVLENDSVCSLSLTSNHLELIGREDQSALLIKDVYYFQKWSGKHEFNCKFWVTSSLELGVAAVIQQMSFRRDATGCIDYVQFRRAERTLQFLDIHFKMKSHNDWSPKICGRLNKFGFDSENDYTSSKSYSSDDSLAVNSFVGKTGVEVRIHIGNKSLEVGESLKFEIVFTAYQECNYDNGHWRNCGTRTCIYKDFFNDGYINCPYRNCMDENGCYPTNPIYKSGDRFNTSFGTKIMAGTVAGLFTMFVAFIAFLWLFRHCGTAFCCIGHPNSHPHSSEMQPVPNLDSMAVLTTAPQDVVVASSADVRTADKDLPPSYESLFPSK